MQTPPLEQLLAKRNKNNLDEEIRAMAHMSMGDVVYVTEHGIPNLGFPNSESNAKQWLTSLMFTDAVLNQDIRVIQTIINRIDGGLPKDTELDSYQTLFGDTLNEVLEMKSQEQITVRPEDTVMMALCKSLFSIAVKDIYHKTTEKGDSFVTVKINPTTEAKQMRDSALRLILERAGGRKTSIPNQKELQDVNVAGWIQDAIASGTEEPQP